jgi:hypothetical protein
MPMEPYLLIICSKIMSPHPHCPKKRFPDMIVLFSTTKADATTCPPYFVSKFFGQCNNVEVTKNKVRSVKNVLL